MGSLSTTESARVTVTAFGRRHTTEGRVESYQATREGPIRKFCLRRHLVTDLSRGRAPSWSGRLEDEDRKRGQRERERVRLSLPRPQLGPCSTLVSKIAAAVLARVAIDRLSVIARPRNPDPVGAARHRREVAYDDHELARVLGAPRERHHALLPIGAVDPSEPGRVGVELMESPLAPVAVVEVAHEPLEPAVVRTLGEQVPVEAPVVMPLAALPALAAHEKELLAGVRPHVRIERAQGGKLLPIVAGHLGEERPLAVHDLVVRERQHEVLRPRVHEAEGQLVVVILAVHRIEAHVVEDVVHPSHIPLEPEAKPAEVRRTRDQRPRGRLFRGDDHAWMCAVDDLVHTPEEGDGAEVLASTELVRHPLSGFARIVEIERGGDGVDPETVGVIAVEPEERAVEQEVADLVASIVEDERAPVGMFTLPRVGVLVEVGAIEVDEAVWITWEVRRHPVQDDADASAVEMVHEGHELSGAAVAA